MSLRNGDPFPPTPWSEFNQVTDADPERAQRAFANLCGYYRPAIVQWMRLQRLSPEDAEDAAHDFLLQWLRRQNPLRNFRRGEGSFRGFLRVCLRNFLIDWLASRARGDRKISLPLKEGHWIALDDGSSAYVDFVLARQIHDDALACLRKAWADRLPEDSFNRLQGVALGATENPGYEALASQLGTSVGTVKSWVFRFRREYHDAFREAVRLQADPSSIDEDLVHLHSLLLRPPVGVPEDCRLQPAETRPD